MKTILVPLDGSSLSEKVLPYSVLLAAHFNAELFLVRILKEDGGHDQESEKTAGEYLEKLKQFLLGEGNSGELIRSFVSQVPGRDKQTEKGALPYKITLQVAKGEPADQIVKIATRLKADLVAMSTHGRAGLSRVFKGSVAYHVLHESPFPLLLVHPEDDKTGLEKCFKTLSTDFIHRPILVPLDGKPLAEAAIPLARQVAMDCEAPIILLQVLSYQPDLMTMAGASSVVGGIPDPVDYSKIEEEANRYLIEIEQKSLTECPRMAHKVIEGDPSVEILKYAEKHGIGFIVMATHARTGLGRATLGSVTEQILHSYKNHPLLVIHPPSQAGH